MKFVTNVDMGSALKASRQVYNICEGVRRLFEDGTPVSIEPIVT